jgi:hypothetical protein
MDFSDKDINKVIYTQLKSGYLQYIRQKARVLLWIRKTNNIRCSTVTETLTMAGLTLSSPVTPCGITGMERVK